MSMQGEIGRLMKQGKKQEEIKKYLKGKGYKDNEIKEALESAQTRKEMARLAGLKYEDIAEDETLRASRQIKDSGQISYQTMAKKKEELPAPSAVSEEDAPTYGTETQDEQQQYEYAPVPQEQQQQYQYYQQYSSPENAQEIAEQIIEEKWQEFKEKTGDIQDFKSYVESELKQLNERMKRLETNFDRVQQALMAKIMEYDKNVKTLGKNVEAVSQSMARVLKPILKKKAGKK